MKVKNKITNIVFNLPKEEVEILINENPNIYEKISKSKKKIEQKTENIEQNTILPLIWEK